VLPDKTAPKQLRGFQKGQSGNPAGRAQGSRTKSTLFAEAILENDREGIMDAVVNAAKNGDPTAMRLCVERLMSLRKGRPAVFPLTALAMVIAMTATPLHATACAGWRALYAADIGRLNALARISADGRTKAHEDSRKCKMTARRP
jgi:hypothetical protein